MAITPSQRAADSAEAERIGALEKAAQAIDAATLRLSGEVSTAAAMGPDPGALRASFKAFAISARGAAAAFGDHWVATVSSSLEDMRQQLEDYLNTASETRRRGFGPGHVGLMPEASAAIAERHQDLQRLVETFRESVARPLFDEAGAAGRRLDLVKSARSAEAKLPPQGAPPDTVVNVLMTVLQFYQFNVTINTGTAFEDRVKAAAEKVEEPAAREELLRLTTDVRAALAAGQRERAREALQALGAWCEKSQGKAGAAIGVVGVLLTILQMLLGG